MQCKSGSQVHCSSNRYCCLYGCLNSKSKKPELSFYGLPPNFERHSKWLRLMWREDLINKPPRHYFVCQDHFQAQDVLNTQSRNVLKKTAVPSLNLPGPAPEACIVPKPDVQHTSSDVDNRIHIFTHVTKTCLRPPPEARIALIPEVHHALSDVDNRTRRFTDVSAISLGPAPVSNIRHKAADIDNRTHGFAFVSETSPGPAREACIAVIPEVHHALSDVEKRTHGFTDVRAISVGPAPKACTASVSKICHNTADIDNRTHGFIDVSGTSSVPAPVPNVHHTLSNVDNNSHRFTYTRKVSVNTQTTLNVSSYTRQIRKLKADLSECRKKLKQQRLSVKTEKRFFHKLCDKFLNKELAVLVKAQTALKVSSKGNRYEQDYKVFCVNLFYTSPKAYRLLRSTLCLPSPKTLRERCLPIADK